jgi:hypothetical protein
MDLRENVDDKELQLEMHKVDVKFTTFLLLTRVFFQCFPD